jgi:hypothetical protein
VICNFIDGITYGSIVDDMLNFTEGITGGMKRVIFFGAHVLSLKSSVNLLTMDSLTYQKLLMSILPMEFFVRDPINKIITGILLV